MSRPKRAQNANSLHYTEDPIFSQPEISYIIKSVTKVAQRHKFNSTKLKRRYFQKIAKKVNAKFARRPKLTPKMFMRAFNNPKDIAGEFKKAFLEVYPETEAEHERAEVRKVDEQKEEEVCKRLEGIILNN